MTGRTFPEQFVWGTATASYQIEGAVREDGRGPSIWDTFSHTPGRTYNGDTGDVACDHYHRWRDDVQLMRDLGVNAYRFSVAWPRVRPNGGGAINSAGLDFYDRLVDALLAARITPFVTLYHWDLPQALQDRGGWAHRDTAEMFVEYADIVTRRLGDRVKHWITHNEPWVASLIGHFEGIHAPGLRDLRVALQAAHHLLLSHGMAASALRSNSTHCRVGITLNLTPVKPASDSQADIEAAQRYDGFHNRWFLDPVFGRGYPEDVQAFYGNMMPEMQPGDAAAIAAPIDFLGINYYFPTIVRAARDATPVACETLTTDEYAAAGYTTTAMGWPVDAGALLELLTRIQNDYAPPAIYITENGAAFDDQLVNGEVHDTQRIAYLSDHLGAARDALDVGVPLWGYFAWSLMDNFEWSFGYSKRFGIVYTDYATQQRIPKASARWYQQVVGGGGI